MLILFNIPKFWVYFNARIIFFSECVISAKKKSPKVSKEKNEQFTSDCCKTNYKKKKQSKKTDLDRSAN